MPLFETFSAQWTPVVFSHELAEVRSLKATAGGREVWLETRWKTHCRLGRYRSW